MPERFGPGGIDVLVVGWFPSAGDPGAGRFVADQVAALRATGRVRPWVATFEGIPLFGAPGLRSAAEAATERHLVTAIESGSDPFAERGVAGPPGVPVARLGFAAGETRRTGPEHGFRHRELVLAALTSRPDRPSWRLVHGHVGYPEGAAAARAASRLGVPFVLTEHATYLARIFGNPIQRARYVETLRAAARVVTVTHMLGRELVDELGREVPDLGERLVVIPNAIAIEDFPVVGPANRDPAELLWVGYRKPVKGIATLLQAFARVREARPDARLRLIGASVAPTDDDHWWRLAASLGVSDGVSIEGPTDRAGVAAAMARAGVFVHPSNRETFGVVAAEALATGLPVVATDSGGVTEVLGSEPGRFGALVPRGDPGAMAEAILATLARRDEFDPWRLRRWVEEHYAAAAVAARLLDLYGDVLGATPAESGVGAAVPFDPRSHRAARARSSAPAESRIIVVGFHRSILDRSLPNELALPDGAAIVSTGSEGAQPHRWIVTGPDLGQRLTALLARGWQPPRTEGLVGSARRGARVGRTGLARLARRLRTMLRGVDDDAELMAALRRALAAALTDSATGNSAGEGARPPLLVCVTGIDHLIAEPFVRAGARVAPGGLAWLADHLAGERSDRGDRHPAATEIELARGRKRRAPHPGAPSARHGG